MVNTADQSIGTSAMSLLESVTVVAFAVGLLSAFSLPLGTLTTRVWTPDNRSVAVLMAFGGGALLAALAIDLVGPALERGHFLPLAVGAIAGGLLFRLLNDIINNKGGFLRKSSTVILHLQRRQRERLARVFAKLRRAPFLAGLSADTVKDLAGRAFTLEIGAGQTVYRHEDPSERIYIVDSGAVRLSDPHNDMATLDTLGPGDAFGHMGCITGAPRASFVVATAPTRLWVLTADVLRDEVEASPELAQHIVDFLHGEPVAAYLQDRHRLPPDQVRAWVDEAVENIRRGRFLPAAVEIKRNRETFVAVSDRISRFPLFRDLPAEELEAVADIVICKHHHRGETLFHQNEVAERLYIVEHGRVALIDPAQPTRRPVEIGDNDMFGGFAFLTGARHTVSAVVDADTDLWVIRKRDFDALLRRCPTLAEHVRSYLQGEEVERYLETRHSFDPDRATRWARKAIKSLDTGGLIPSAAAMASEVRTHAGAPLAIWLGILLDGIPEAFVIGANVLYGGHVSYSLIAGLFLSNFPEALSSSVGMRQQGMTFGRVLLMWTSLMVLTGVFAALGATILVGAPLTVVSLLEGIAAGAMLTMIAETMMPEAYYKGGSVVGLSTLAGFLVAIFFTTLE